MASIFKPPKITQEQLSSTLLEYGEIVYNTTKNEFFTGNGTSGGITLFNEKPTTTSELINDSNFVTSSDVEESLSAYQPISGMNIYALKSDIPSGGSGTGDSYTFPLEQRTFICMSESVSEDGSIGHRNVGGVLHLPQHPAVGLQLQLEPLKKGVGAGHSHLHPAAHHGDACRVQGVLGGLGIGPHQPSRPQQDTAEVAGHHAADVGDPLPLEDV